MNYMTQIAQMLGVELGEEFGFKNACCSYRITRKNIEYYDELNQCWAGCSSRLVDILNGSYKIIKLPKPILDDVEKEYLSNVIKPFRKQVISIGKLDSGEYECIVIKYRNINGYTNTMCFPYFEKGTIYKSMEIGKRYSLSELEL